MTDINIILDTDFTNTSNESQTDTELFYELLNNDFDIYKLNSYSKYIVEYNQILIDLLENDNYINYENNLSQIDDINIKKLILKKIFIFFNPKLENIIVVNKKNNVINSEAISLNYSLLTKYSNYNKIVPANTYFLINGFFNKKYLNINLPYQFNQYKYYQNIIIDLLKNNNIIDTSISINASKLKYNNATTQYKKFSDLNQLKEIYKIYLNYVFMFFENAQLLNNYSKMQIINTNPHAPMKPLVSVEFNKYITQFNSFLQYKINNYFNNHSYYAFQSSGLLNLYEEILIYSLDDINIKNKIQQLIIKNQSIEQTFKNKKLIDEYNLKYIQIEFIARNKFPNLFNKNSKECLFTNLKIFKLDDLPKKYKDIVLIEYKKLQTLMQQKNNNNCKHKQLINDLSFSKYKYKTIKDITTLIKENTNNSNEYYKCSLCSFNLICPHVFEYYNLLFTKNKYGSEFKINQYLINKYMTPAKVNMIYYCKICGEELGKSVDVVQSQQKYESNKQEYTDMTIELIKNNVIHIIYSYTTLTSANLSITKSYLINYIISTISSNINLIEKSLRKSKLYNEEQIKDLLNFNSIVFIYSTIIYMMTKYTFISFSNNNKVGLNSKNIIIPKKIEIKSNKDLLNLIKIRFKEAYNLIITTNNILLFKLKYNKQHEKIKELLLKSYSVISKTDQLEIADATNKISNANLIQYSSVYNYLKYIKIIESSYTNTDKVNFISSLPLATLNKYKYNKINLIPENVLNVENINSNKFNNIFIKYTSILLNDNVLEDVLKTNTIKNYNHYKIVSLNLFYYHIKHELYNLPIYNYISLDKNNDNNYSKLINDNVYNDKLINYDDNNKYNIFIKLTHILKSFEIKLIQKNINYSLYPISFIKLNNSRYFYDSLNKINLNKYFCPKDGKMHNFNIYVYNKSDNSYIEFNKKNIDTNISDIIKLQFNDYKCNKCGQLKNKTDSNNLSKIISDNNDKEGFFNLYINVCPILNNNKYQYHQFDSTNLKCSICKISYDDLLNKNIEIYYKFNKEYTNYKINKQEIINKELNVINNKIKTSYELNIIDILNSKVSNIQYIKSNNNNPNNKIISYIDNINLDTIIVNISKLFKFTNSIEFLQKLGLTEGINYNLDEISNITNVYNSLRINKLINYFRTIIIYYNQLKYNSESKLQFYDSEFTNSILNINSNIIKLIPEISYNISDLVNLLKLTNDDKYIVNFLIKLIFQFILDLDKINISKLDNQLNTFIEFLFFKIIKCDELFTNYNYSQLKQMFTDDKISYSNEDYSNEDNDDEEEELFEYNDLSIQFEDEDPID